LTKEQEELSLKPINRHQECSTKRERARTKERRREKEREGLPPAALLPYAAAAQCSNLRWELSGCDPPPCVVFFLYL